jgi:hypothetical protein
VAFAAPCFSAAEEGDANSAIDIITESAGYDSLEICLDNWTEYVSFADGTDLGTAGLILKHDTQNPANTTSPVKVVIDGGGRTVDLTDSPTGFPLITVGEGVTLTLRNITFKGLSGEGGENTNTASLINVAGGHLILEEGAVITGNTASVGGAGVQGNAGSITMNSGAIISDNETTATVGGGIYIDENAPFNFTMNGGTITNNKALNNGWGGGIGINGNHTFIMTGGAISGNKSSIGGGVLVYNGGVFTMSGGEISDNNTAGGGGGVYLGWDSAFTMNGGEIKGNKASYGGGVCINESDGGVTFIKAKEDAAQGIAGGVIYGNDFQDTNLANTAADNKGHAVYYYKNNGIGDDDNDGLYYTRNSTAGKSVSLDSSTAGKNGGWDE